jgi:hypothetical protein
MKSATLGVSLLGTDQELLRRLLADPRDAEALMSLYEDHEVEIRAAAGRWFGGNRELCKQCIHNILVAIGRNAGTYDPQSTDAAEWVRNGADTEARRLREALDAASSRGRRTRRAE